MPRSHRSPLSVVRTLALVLVIPAVTLVAVPTRASAAADSVDEILSTFGNDGTSMSVHWRGAETTLSYGETAAYGGVATAVAPSVTPVDNPGPFRVANLVGLIPGTLYHYRIGADGLDHTFTTMPTGDFVWDDVGDTASTLCKPWEAGTHAQIAADHPTFVTHGGDLTYANECGVGAVHSFFNDIAPWATTAAFEVAWGNHEYGLPRGAPAGTPRDSMANYKGRLTLPNPQTVPIDKPKHPANPGCPSPVNPSLNGCMGSDWGWFQAGHVLFISEPEPWVNAYQDWQIKADALMAKAQADPNVTFIVTWGHRPAYTSLVNNRNGVPQIDPGLKTAIDALGDKYSPAAIPGGKYVLNVNHHVHGAELFAAQHGVVHITNGGGGTEETHYKQSSPGSLWNTGHPEHLRVTVQGSTMVADFICGPVFDPAPLAFACTPGSVIRTVTFSG